MNPVADAIRKVTAAMQKELESGDRSAGIDTNDLVDVLLAIADELDPPFGEPVAEEDACPKCGERQSDNLVWQDDETVRCANCGHRYQPGR